LVPHWHRPQSFADAEFRPPESDFKLINDEILGMKSTFRRKSQDVLHFA
jgi:hypothetical protein